jgi:UDP-N-acetylmuramoyl-tripeptide--D-alanyl-D-alanine ligase
MTAALWTSHEVQVATAGKLAGEWSATGVSIDSRTLKPGDLFIAIDGPNFDGHKFVDDALSKGAVAALVSYVPDGVDPKANLLIVDNTLYALEKMASASRARTSAKIIAVTGSVGKTSAKEALKHVLSDQGETYATEGSLNNHWGLPLSLARLPRTAKYGVFELGMNHPGEIGPLTKLTRPHVALITTIEAVHSAHFKSIEEIADAKAEIFHGLEPDGTAILNRDNSQFAHLHMKAKSLGIKNLVSFGSSENADLKIINFEVDADYSNVTAQFKEDELQYRISIPGYHWVLNSLGILGGVAAAGGDIVAAAIALSQLSPMKGRGQSCEVHLKDGAFTLIDDSYNASPVSVAASLAVLGRVHLGMNGRRIAVLGDMLELGADSIRRHEELSTPLRENKIDLVFTTGADMESLSNILPKEMQGGHAGNSEKLAPIVQNAIRSGDAVSVKGSAGSKMSVVVQTLLAMGKNSMSAAPFAASGH